MDGLPLPGQFKPGETIYDYVQLSDNHGNISSNNETSITAFTSPVFKNKKVKWEFQKNEKNMKIKIKKKETSDNKELIKDKKDGEKGSVIYEVKAKDKDGKDFKEGDMEYYNIVITIDGKEYPPIDPVLEWHPQ